MDSVEAVTSELGNRVRQRRMQTGRTLADVASESDVSVSYLAAIEAGRNVPSLSVLSRVAHSLGLSMSELLRASSDRTRMAFGRIDAAQAGVASISHPDLRLSVKAVVADPGDRGASPFEELGPVVVIHVISGQIQLTFNDERYELLEGDSLHATRAASLDWEAGPTGRSVSLWATVPAEPRQG